MEPKLLLWTETHPRKESEIDFGTPGVLPREERRPLRTPKDRSRTLGRDHRRWDSPRTSEGGEEDGCPWSLTWDLSSDPGLQVAGRSSGGPRRRPNSEVQTGRGPRNPRGFHCQRTRLILDDNCQEKNIVTCGRSLSTAGESLIRVEDLDYDFQSDRGLDSRPLHLIVHLYLTYHLRGCGFH